MRTALRSTSSLAAVSLLALGACGGPSGTDDAAIGPDAGAPIDTGVAIDAFRAEDAPSPNDAPTPPDAVRLAPDAFVSIDATEPTMPTYSYVVSVIAADEVAGGEVAGIDIDGIDSGRGRGAGTCEQRRPDFVSSVTSLPGVDNQLSNTLLSTLTSMGVDINANLEAAIADGTFLLLLTVDDLEDFVNDPDGVTVTIGLGTTVSGSRPTLSGGLIAPGQSFRRTMTLGTGTATLTGNRVIVSVPRIPIPLVLGGTATADLEDSQLSARISASELFDGEGGGGLSVQALVDFAATNGFGDVAMALLPTFSDLNPSDEDPAVCDSISAGFRLEAVSATVVP